MTRRTFAVALVAAAGLSIVGACADDANDASSPDGASRTTSPDGVTASGPDATGSRLGSTPATTPATSSATLPATDPSAEAAVVGLYGLAMPVDNGVGTPLPRYLELAAGSEGRLFDDLTGLGVSSFRYAVDGDLLRVRGWSASGCDAGTVGVYRWTFDAELVLSVEDDPCTVRSDALTSRSFVRSGWTPLDVPLLDGTSSVEVGSPIGTITWSPRQPDPDITQLDPWPALGSTGSVLVELVTIEGRNVLRSSTDGVTWTELPPPPGIPQLLVAEGPTITVVVGDETTMRSPTWPLTMYATDDLGATWRPIAVEPPPAGTTLTVGGFDVGGAGAIVPTMTVGDGPGTAGPVWIGDASGLEMVDAPWAGDSAVEALSLDSGFLVRSGSDRPSWERSWTSTDGRTWTPVDDPPCSSGPLSHTGDTVYAEGCGRSIVVSDDAGATWSTPESAPPLGERLDLGVGRTAVVQKSGVPCGSWLTVSADEQVWSRVFEPWPPVFVLGAAAIDGVVLLRTSACSEVDEVVDWVGTIG